jgi:hypothetical protein
MFSPDNPGHLSNTKRAKTEKATIAIFNTTQVDERWLNAGSIIRQINRCVISHTAQKQSYKLQHGKKYNRK